MHKKMMVFTVLLALAALLCGCFGGAGGTGKTVQRPAVESSELQFVRPAAGDTIAVFVTSKGEFRAVLFPQQAPQACDNFIGLVQSGWYDGLTFTRVESGFVVEAGQDVNGASTTLWNGNGYPAEVTDQLHHYSGALCAALSEEGEGGSVFYVMQTLPGALSQELVDQMNAQGWRQEVIAAYQTAGGAPYLDYTDTVFGQVYEGMEVVDAIAAAAVDEAGRPTEEIVLQSVTISTYE